MWKPRLFYLIGCWVLVIGALQFLPVLYALIIGEKASFHAFFAAFFSSILIGGSLYLGFRDTSRIRMRRLTILLPVFGIVAMAFFAGLPFFFLVPDMGLIAAFYDGMSLLTTNGTSAYEGMPRVESLEVVAFWRSIVAWVGGYMAICLALSLFSAMNIGGLQLHKSPMPFGDSELGYVRLKATVYALYPVYIAMTLLCLILLYFSGAGSLIECLNMAMITISSTGIPAIYGDALSYATSQVIIAFFLVLSIMNWDVHYMRFNRRKLRYGNELEYRGLLITILVGAVFIIICDGSYSFDRIWAAFFSAVSAVSTSGVRLGLEDGGFVEFALPVAIILMLLAAIGGAVISPSGGLKQLRAIIFFKTGKAEIERLAHPHAVAGIHYDEDRVSKSDMEAIWLLLGSFVLVIVLGSLALAVFGIHFQDALSMAFTAVTLSGPLIHVSDPYFGGFAGLGSVDYGILSVLMLIGRIEASIFFALFLKTLWRG